MSLRARPGGGAKRLRGLPARCARGGAAALALGGLVALGACGEAFDPTRWAAEAGNWTGPSDRQALYAAARDRLPAGTPRSAVHALLGMPDCQAPGEDIYALGRGRWSVDFDMLRVRYDDAGTVASIIVGNS